MSWNFRLVKHTERRPRRVWYGVHEVFYNAAGQPWTMTIEPVNVDGDSPQDVVKYLEMIRRDLLRLPVLDARKIRRARRPSGLHGERAKRFNSVKDLMRELRG